MGKFRIDRVNEEIKKAISSCIQNDLRDSRITGLITVTRVDTATDLKTVKVYLSVFDKNRNEIFEILKKSAGKMKNSIARNVKIRFIPEIDLKMDNSIEYSFHIDEILKKTNKEDFNND